MTDIIDKLTQEEWDTLREARPVPIPCHRCGRMLTSAASIARRMGATCAFSQALEALSHTKEPSVRKEADRLIAFRLTEGGWYDIVDVNDKVVGRLEKHIKGQSWMIYVFNNYVDIDGYLENAKRRAERIFAGLWS